MHSGAVYAIASRRAEKLPDDVLLRVGAMARDITDASGLVVYRVLVMSATPAIRRRELKPRGSGQRYGSRRLHTAMPLYLRAVWPCCYDDADTTPILRHDEINGASARRCSIIRLAEFHATRSHQQPREV